MKKISFMLVLLVFIFPFVNADSVVLDSAELISDTYVYKWGPTDNQDSELNLNIMSDGPTHLFSRVYVMYNLSLIPDYANVVNAYYNTTFFADTGYTIKIFEVYANNTWTPYVINWNNQPCGTSNLHNDISKCNTTEETSLSLTSTGKNYFNITRLLQEAINENKVNVSFMLDITAYMNDWGHNWRSSEYSTVADRPSIHIDYLTGEDPSINSVTLSKTGVLAGNTIQINVSCTDESEVDFINLSTNITGTWQNVSGYDCSSSSCLAVFDYVANTAGHGQFKATCTDTTKNVVVDDSSQFVVVSAPDQEYRFEQNGNDSIGNINWNSDNGNGMTYLTPSFVDESYAINPSNQGFESEFCNNDWDSKSHSVWLKPDWSSNGCHDLSRTCTIFMQKESKPWQYKHMILLNESTNSRYTFSLISNDGTSEINHVYFNYSDSQNLIETITNENGFLLTFTFSDNSENGRTRIYVNNQLVGEHEIDGGFNGLMGKCSIMYNSETNDTFYAGEADLYRIWQTIELTPSEVNLLWREYASIINEGYKIDLTVNMQGLSRGGSSETGGNNRPYPMEVGINFTELLNSLNSSEEVDNNSIRVYKYDSFGNEVEIDSTYFTPSSTDVRSYEYNNKTNAYYTIQWYTTDTFSENDLVNYSIHFKTSELGNSSLKPDYHNDFNVYYWRNLSLDYSGANGCSVYNPESANYATLYYCSSGQWIEADYHLTTPGTYHVWWSRRWDVDGANINFSWEGNVQSTWVGTTNYGNNCSSGGVNRCNWVKVAVVNVTEDKNYTAKWTSLGTYGYMGGSLVFSTDATFVPSGTYKDETGWSITAFNEDVLYPASISVNGIVKTS